jgi:hypothetical protein
LPVGSRGGVRLVISVVWSKGCDLPRSFSMRR